MFLIYEYFEDRDGLLARVLGDMHDERIDHWETLFSHALSDSMPRGEYTVENMLTSLPLLNSNAFQSLGWDRAQVLAALKENPKLRARIEQTTQRLFSLTLKVVSNADESKHPNPGLHRVMSLVISSLNLIFINNDLLGDQKITDDGYKLFLKTYFSGFQKQSNFSQ